MPITYRPIEPGDNRATYEILADAIEDLGRRKGVQGDSTAELDPDAAWELRRPLWEHIAATASHAWLAEDGGRGVGYARSILRDGHLELTEFFVRPGVQDAGVGRELLERAFPRQGELGAPGSGSEVRVRSIVATSDLRALSRYLRTGVVGRFPIYAFVREPRPVDVAGDLEAVRIDVDVPGAVDALAEIDRVVLGLRRDVDHRFLARDRLGWLYRRDGRPVGYGYHGRWSGPFAALEPADLPPILARAEAWAAGQGLPTLACEVPLVNGAAVEWLLGRGFRLDPFVTFFMSDTEFGRFDRYVLTSPPLFL